MLKSGMRLQSQVCDTQVIVVRPAEVELTCGGRPMILVGEQPPTGVQAIDGLLGGTLLGKRYTDKSQKLEILVTKAGHGTIGDGSEPLVLKSAKPLPSSD